MRIQTVGRNTRITFCDVNVKDIEKWNVSQMDKSRKTTEKLDNDVASVESFDNSEFEHVLERNILNIHSS